MSRHPAARLRRLRFQPTRSDAGATYTFMVLATSITLLIIGATLLRPSELALQIHHARQHRLIADELTRAGLNYALAQDSIPSDEPVILELSTGRILITSRSDEDGSLILTISGQPGRSLVKDGRPSVLEVRVRRANGRHELLGLTGTSGQPIPTRSQDLPPLKETPDKPPEAPKPRRF